MQESVSLSDIDISVHTGNIKQYIPIAYSIHELIVW